MKITSLFFFILISFKFFCQNDSKIHVDSSFIITEAKLDSIIQTGLKHVGTKYVYAGTSPSGFDCSGLMYYIFKQYGIKISRASSFLASTGYKVSISEIKKGDLLFFKGRNISSNKVGHVSLCIEVTKDSFKMLHATNRGVVVDTFNKISYYQKRLLFARRFLKLK